MNRTTMFRRGDENGPGGRLGSALGLGQTTTMGGEAEMSIPTGGEKGQDISVGKGEIGGGKKEGGR